MDVYAPGSKVMIADGSIPATISCVAVYDHGGVQYEVVWWKDSTRHSSWMSETELQTEKEKTKVGFKTNGDRL